MLIALVRFTCPACESVFQSGARPPPSAVACPACAGPMAPEADVLELRGDRVPTRPYDLASLRAKLEEEREAAGSNELQIWYVGVHGRSVGPLTPAGLAGLAARGQLERGTLVWREGWPSWTAAAAVAELRPMLGLPEAAPAGDPPELPGGRP